MWSIVLLIRATGLITCIQGSDARNPWVMPNAVATAYVLHEKVAPHDWFAIIKQTDPGFNELMAQCPKWEIK